MHTFRGAFPKSIVSQLWSQVPSLPAKIKDSVFPETIVQTNVRNQHHKLHPQMKIVSSFTHPQVVPNLYECLCSAEHKGRYSEECGKQSSSGAPLTFIVFFFPTMEVKGAPNSLVTNFLQNIILCVRQNKDIHTGLELLEGE